MANLGSQSEAVESVTGKVSGAWVLRGTRMPVSAIFENIAAGASIDDLTEWFEGLDREQVRAVVEFAAQSGQRAVLRCLSFALAKFFAAWIELKTCSYSLIRPLLYRFEPTFVSTR
jgi:uncharacterized protein (DUF433 family)